MLNRFDIISLPDGGYQLVSGWSFVRVDFDDDIDKKMFDYIVDNNDKSIASLLKAMIKLADRQRVFDFFDKLRQARLIQFESGQGLFEGRVSEASPIAEQILQIRSRPIGVIGNASLAQYLTRQPNFVHSEIADWDILHDEAAARAFAQKNDLVIVDAVGATPGALLKFNKVALESKTPWMIVQGVFDNAGHVGPIFSGGDTGCFQCFHTRLRSNAGSLAAFDGYAAWLNKTGKAPAQASLPSEAYPAYLASIVALEAEKFLGEYDITQSYGYLLDVNFRDYSVKPHRLYKVPFCEACGGEFEHRTAPWLESISLAVA